MSLAILGTLLGIWIAWRIWRQGGLITALLALAFGAVVAAAGGPMATAIQAAIGAMRTVIGWLSDLLF